AAGPHAGLRSLDDRVDAGTDLIACTSENQRAEAVIYDEIVDPAMPEGRIHPGDERHLAGASQDNRVIPYEGVQVATLDARAQEAVVDLVATVLNILPEGPRRAKVREVREHLNESYFSWIGGTEPGDVFYYRFQSPVLLIELDHHCGVFLDYDVPPALPCAHAHARTPRQRLRPRLGPPVAASN